MFSDLVMITEAKKSKKGEKRYKFLESLPFTESPWTSCPVPCVPKSPSLLEMVEKVQWESADGSDHSIAERHQGY